MRKPIKLAGVPIKERGIRWEENYGDKSAYLKEEFEKQVGPGSYFRWEGHDHTSGSDYYAVVTPGFSKKHGYHFFAALRKMPADNGASGKKFSTQAEALSYAYETWRIPPPKTKPHKPYIDKDLVGKPIVTENVHAGLEAVIKTSSKIVIDATHGDLEKLAMGAKNMGGHQLILPGVIGPNDAAAHARWTAIMSTVADPGIGQNTFKQMLLVDTINQQENDLKSGSGHHSRVATCEPPSEELWNSLMGDAGQTIMRPLFKKDYKKNFNFLNPINQQNEGYKVIRLGNLLLVNPSVVVSLSNKAKFDALLPKLQASLKSAVIPDKSLEVQKIDAPDQAETEHEGKTKNVINRGNYHYRLSLPIDLYAKLKAELESTKVASVEKLNKWEQRNASEIFDFLSKPENGGLNTSEAIERAKQTPIAERISMVKGQLVVYNEMGYPVGLKVQKNVKFSKETMGEDSDNNADVKLEFNPASLARWMQQAGGDLATLRQMFAHNQIQFQRTDFVLGQTCAPLNRHVHTNVATKDQDDRYVAEDGKLKTEFKPLVDTWKNELKSNMVRIHNPKTGKQELVSVQEAEKLLSGPIQNGHDVTGLPVVAENSYYLLPSGDPQNPFIKIECGETRIYDPNSRGKLDNGPAQMFLSRVDRVSPKKTNVSRFEKMEQDVYGFYAATRKQQTGLHGVEDTTFKGSGGRKWRLRTVADLPVEHIKNMVAFMSPDGRYFEVQAGADANDPAVQYLGNPSNEIKSYSYVDVKIAEEEPMTTHEATEDDPFVVDKMKFENGEWQPEVDPTTGEPIQLSYGADKLKLGYTKSKNAVFFQSQKDLLEAASSIYRIPLQNFGVIPDVDADDTTAAFDRFREIKKQVDSGVPIDQIPEQDRIAALVPEKGNVLTPEIWDMMKNISPDPNSWKPRTGKVYQIVRVDGQPIMVENNPRQIIYSTLDAATRYKDWMETSNETGAGGGFPPGSLHIVAHDNVDLLISQTKAKMSGQERPLLTNMENVSSQTVDGLPPEQEQGQEQVPGEQAAAPEDLDQWIAENGTMPQSSEDGMSDDNYWSAEVPADQAAPVAEQPVPEAAPTDDLWSDISVSPAQSAPQEDDYWNTPEEAPAPAPVPQPQPQPVAAPLNIAPRPHMTPNMVSAPQAQPQRPAAPAAPAPAGQKRKRPWEASSLNRLIRLANKLDEEGKHEQASSIDQLIELTIKRIKADEEWRNKIE